MSLSFSVIGSCVAPADQPLDGEQGVLGIGHRLALRRLADQPLAVVGEGDHRRRRPRALRVLDDANVLALHDRNAGVRGAEVDADNLAHSNHLFLRRVRATQPGVAKTPWWPLRSDVPRSLSRRVIYAGVRKRATAARAFPVWKNGNYRDQRPPGRRFERMLRARDRPSVEAASADVGEPEQIPSCGADRRWLGGPLRRVSAARFPA